MIGIIGAMAVEVEKILEQMGPAKQRRSAEPRTTKGKLPGLRVWSRSAASEKSPPRSVRKP